jgi:hypothetical protein
MRASVPGASLGRSVPVNRFRRFAQWRQNGFVGLRIVSLRFRGGAQLPIPAVRSEDFSDLFQSFIRRLAGTASPAGPAPGDAPNDVSPCVWIVVWRVFLARTGLRLKTL